MHSAAQRLAALMELKELQSRMFYAWGSQMTAKEFQRALPRQFGRFRLKILALIAIEAVPRVIEKQRHVRLSRLDLFNFCRTDVRIFGTEVHHHWTARFLRSVCRDLSTVVADRCSRIESRGSQPRKTAAKAKSQHANFQSGPF